MSATATLETRQSTASHPASLAVTVARGDGIGPEILDATVRILDAAGAGLRYEEVEIGESAYLAGHTSGLSPQAWEVIRRNPVFLKAPITTPQGGGYKSLNVTIRKALNLFANVRPARSFAPFVPGGSPQMDLIVVRENEEDLYAGIEHQQTSEVAQVLKLVTRPGSERIVRYAFELARAHGRRKVTCMTKDNIMKQTDGLFRRVFEEIAREYPEIESDHMIIDIGAARLATRPERFDVVVTLNLYGDILSDIAAEVAGSVGLAGSANIGAGVSMFEAVHGSAPDIAGTNVANPSGLLNAATQMLVHLGQSQVAETVANAWLATIEGGIHTADIFRQGHSRALVGTREFAEAVIARLGEQPKALRGSSFASAAITVAPSTSPPAAERTLVGVDAFLCWDQADRNPEILGPALEGALPEPWQLAMITNRGVKVYPGGLPETFKTDHWRCRLVQPDTTAVDFAAVLEALGALHRAGFEVIKTEHLYRVDGKAAYSLGQGE